MPLLLNMLSRLVITFLPRSKHLLILWLQSPSAVILEPPKIKSVTVSIVSPSICPEVMGPDAMIFVFECGVVSQLFHSSFTFIKRLFSSSLLSAIKLVSSAYLRLLIFLPAILIPACASSSPAFRMMYSACKLSKQGLMYSFPDFQLLARPDRTLQWAKHKSSSDAGSGRETFSAAYGGLGTGFVTASHLPCPENNKSVSSSLHTVSSYSSPLNFRACFLFYPQRCLSWCTAV